MAGRFSVEAVFKGIDRITAPLTRMENNINKFSRQATSSIRHFNDNIDKTNSKLKQTAFAIGAATIALGYMGKSIVDIGAEFEQEMVKAATRLDVPALKGSKAFEKLSQTAIDVGQTTEFSAIQAAQGFNILAGAGYNAEQAILGLPKLMDMATVAGEDLQSTSSMVNDLMSSFAITKDMEGFSRATDVLAKTANQSNAVLEDLFETMKQAGPLSIRARVSFESIAAMAGIMADAGIKGSLGGTSIKNFLLNLSAPSKKASAMIKKLGMNFKDAKGNLKDIPDLLDEINKRIVGLSSTKQSEAIEILFGKHGLAGMTALLNKGGDAFREYRSQLDKAKGTTQTLAEIIRNTLKQDMDNMASAIESVNIKTVEYSNKSLRGAIQKTTDWINKNDDLIAQNLGDILSTIADNLDNIVFVMKQLAVAALTWVTLTALLKGATLAMVAFDGAMVAFDGAMAVLGVVTAVFGGWILAIAAVVVGLYLLITNWNDTITALEKLTGLDITGFFDGIFDSVKAGIQWVKDLTTSFGELVDAALKWIGLDPNANKGNSRFGNGVALSAPPEVGGRGAGYPAVKIPVSNDNSPKTTENGGFMSYLKENSFLYSKLANDNGENDNQQAPEKQIVSRETRAAKMITENNNNTTTTNKTEITIKDETGRAKVTKGELGSGLKMQSSGGF